MKKWLLIILILLSKSYIFQGQEVVITGIVMCKEDNFEMPGIYVTEKGTQNATVTGMNGEFTLTVSGTNTVLVFSSVGWVTKEIKLNGQQEIKVLMKEECIMDSFDHQHIGLFFASGLIHNPVGAQFEFSFPAFFRSTTLITAMSYQSNLKNNNFLSADIELNHLIFECNFQMDLKWYYRKFSFENDFRSATYAIETNLIFDALNFGNFYNVGLIAGFGKLSLEDYEINEKSASTGPVIGLVADLGKPLYSNVYGKVSVFNDRLEYQGQIRLDHRKLAAFIRFYKLNSYNELSLGIGLNTSYWLKKQKPNHKK